MTTHEMLVNAGAMLGDMNPAEMPTELAMATIAAMRYAIAQAQAAQRMADAAEQIAGQLTAANVEINGARRSVDMAAEIDELRQQIERLESILSLHQQNERAR